MKRQNNIVFIGMMGSGKTSVAKLLSQRTGKKFIDFDILIEEKEKMKIAEIFSLKGEQYFRKIETELAKSFSTPQNLIIATGGGTVLRDENFKNLKRGGVIFYLCSKAEILYDRIKSNKERPLLKDIKDFEQLLKQREEVYKKADYTINSDRDKEKIIDEVMEIYEKSNG